MNTHTRIASEIEGFRINGITPFWSPADAADQQLAQAHALLTLLSGAHSVCDGITSDQADHFENVRHGVTASALEGIASLIALAQFQIDEARNSRHRVTIDRSQWDKNLAAYLDCAEKLAKHERGSSPDGAQTDKLAGNRADAFIAMVLTPAPDCAALAAKVEAYATVVGGDSWDRGEEMQRQIAADARFLAGRV